MTNLKAILSNRYAQFVPIQSSYHKFVAADWFAVQNGLKVSVIQPRQEHVPKSELLHQEYKDFMWSHFYPNAPIPHALQMVKHRSHLEGLVEQEMELYLYSGVSFELRSTIGQELHGLCLVCHWSKDHQYSPLQVKAKEWHNTAAELASEMMPQLPQKAWRLLQFQHLYDICQSAMDKYQASQVLWFGMMALKPQARGQNTWFLGNQTLWKGQSEDILFGTQSNFPGFDRQVGSLFPGATVWDELRYADENLVLEGCPAFKSIHKCEGIKFYFQHLYSF